MLDKHYGHKPCNWKGWLLLHPFYNIGRVYRNIRYRHEYNDMRNVRYPLWR